MKKLRDIAKYSEIKIEIDGKNMFYVGVDNLLPDKRGVIDSVYKPLVGKFNIFKAGDILVGNIRPYFKKIWLADKEGFASSDVLVITPIDYKYSKYIYSALSDDKFFNYTMSGSKGSKMPRGDKDHIMNYLVPDLDNKFEIGKLICDINSKLSLNEKINDNLSFYSMVA